MSNEQLNRFIHRFNLNARAVCGATGRLRFSTSGVGVTCPDCNPPASPSVGLSEALLRRGLYCAAPSCSYLRRDGSEFCEQHRDTEQAEERLRQLQETQ